MSDRTVHARLRNGVEIVRYGRAGKWYTEHPGMWRRHVSITEAAKMAVVAVANGGEVFFGRPGGKAFDAKVRGRA